MRTRIVLAMLLASVLSGCVVRVAEQNLIRPRAGELVSAGTLDEGRWVATPISVKAADGTTLQGAHFSKSGSVAAVLYFGGNGFVLSKHAEFVLSAYRDIPVDLIVLDHRGYGANQGATSLEALFEDGVQIYDQVRAANPDIPLLVHGHSIGSFIAGRVASERQLDGLILESSATTTEEWVRRMAGWKRFLVRIRIDQQLQGQGNLTVVGRLDEPVLFVAGEQDEVTDPEMAEELFAAASVPAANKRLIVVAGADHMQASHSKQFLDGVRWLLARVQKGRRPTE